MRAALSAAFPDGESKYRFDESLFGSFEDYDEMTTEMRTSILRLTDEIDEPAAALVAGHLSLPGMQRLVDERDTFTVLREPRARLLSHQLYWALRPVKDSYRGYKIELLSLDGLRPFLRNDDAAHQHDNLMCRMLAANRCPLPIDRAMTEPERAVAAAAAIEAVESLGLTTYLESPTMWQDVSAFVGAPIQKVSVNVTQPRQGSATFFGPQFDQATQELLHERTAADAILFNHVVCATTGCTPAEAARLADMHYVGQIERYARVAAVTEQAVPPVDAPPTAAPTIEPATPPSEPVSAPVVRRSWWQRAGR